MNDEDREGVSAIDLANTPSWSDAVATSETLAELEFPRAIDTVARFAVSPLGAQAVRSRLPSASLAWISAQLADVSMYRRLLIAGTAPDPHPITDVRPLLERVRTAGSLLDGEALSALRAALEAMHAVRDGLESVRQEAPGLADWAVELPPRAVDGAIARAIEPDGSVCETASPQLARARKQLRSKRKALVAFLERVLSDRQCGDGGVTLRGDRYVIPVRRDKRHAVRGIVHGESASGATLFMEPPEAVELGNELSSLEAEAARAELAVLRDLTDRLRPHAQALEDGLMMCVRIDDLAARARYAAACDGHTPEVSENGPAITVTRCAHPLLLEDPAVTPVPFDLAMAPGERVLVVTGPNAGGKTVLLKAIGLLCCLTQAGIVPPTGVGTGVTVFRRIFVDIGDRQSIAENLSSFSAHLTRLKQILAAFGNGSLVLLDELGGGTDPVEGAALAGAALLALNARESVTLATTHLTQLKELAAETPGMVNGSLHFDVETLSPTYRFVKGQPGRSYGIAMARRLGLPEEVLATAEALEPEQARQLDAVLEDLERRETRLSEREEAAAAEQRRLEHLALRLDELQRDLAVRSRALGEQQQQVEREGREQARRFLLDARQRVEEALALARAAVSEATAKEARRLVEEGVREEGDALAKLQREGWRVRGAKKTIRPGEDREDARVPSRRRDETWSRVEVEAATEIDLRGMSGDEAAFDLTKAIDGAVTADLPFLRIIHGKGTGRLRQRVIEVLRADARVRSYRAAPPQEGGAGVTVAELRA